MQHSTNVLWKLNAKGLELLNKAGIIPTTSQVLAPKASQDLTSSQFVQKTNEESVSLSTSQNTESLKENSSFIEKKVVNESVRTIIDQRNLQNAESVAPLSASTESLTSAKYNIPSSTPKAVSTTVAEQTNANINNDINLVPITNWHLRKKKADIFIEDLASIAYLEGLKKFLTSKDIKWQSFDPAVHYLPYDLLLITHASYRNEGDCAFLEDGKAQVWDFLKQHFNLS